MKKKLGVIITLLTLCICLMTPQMHVQAASGKTTIAVSASSLNIGQTVTVTAKALGASGESAYANMVLTYDASILEFVSCTATYGGGGGSISVANDSFSVTLKAIAAGKASLSLSATDGVIFSTAEELESMAGSSTSVTVNNEAAGGNSTNNGSSGNNGNAGNGSNAAALSADNSLKALTISPGTLSPAFKGSTTKYTAAVDNSVTSIAVSATPVNEKATIESVTGNTNLAVGANVVKIVVKAENGTTATYKITVTRQAAGTTGSETTTTGGENGDDGNGDSETPEDTEEVDTTETPVSAADVVINNTTYHIADNFTEEQIPADFTEAMVNFRGAECRGLTFNKGTISLIYLETDNVDATTGRFFIYDETRDVVYDFMKFTAGESSYAIPLLAPLDSVLPESYVQVSLQMPENTVMTAYQLPVEDGEETSDFYIFYGVNQDGTEGWYQYDAAEGTYQRVNGNITETADFSSDDLAALQSEYDELSKKYKDAKSFSRNMIAVIIFVLAIAVVIILNIVLFGRKKQGKDELLEDDDSENEESEYESDEEDVENEETENEKKSLFGKFHGFRKKEKNEDDFLMDDDNEKTEETKEAQELDEDEDGYFDDEEEYIEEDHPINRAYREWNDYEDEIPSPSKKPVTEEISEKESSTENEKMDVPQQKEKGLKVFDLNDL